MNRHNIERLTRAVLYEGYVLYPYRPSVKNTQRWTFGGIYPDQWCENQQGDASMIQVECLISPRTAEPRVNLTLRFLHLVDRTVGRLCEPVERALFAACDPADWNYHWVERLTIDSHQYQAWQEAVEVEVDLGAYTLDQLIGKVQKKSIGVRGSRTWEALRSDEGDAEMVQAVLRREAQAIDATATITATQLRTDLVKIRLVVRNTTGATHAAVMSRRQAQLLSLASAHVVLNVDSGAFVSLTDPPLSLSVEAAGCQNVGLWPILLGEPGQRDVLLAAPIILGDYPQLAPESPGDLFDGSEIDEILTLRIMTMTDEEKCVAAATDERVRALLARTQTLAGDELMNLHGAVRTLRPVAEQNYD